MMSTVYWEPLSVSFNQPLSIAFDISGLYDIAILVFNLNFMSN